jgi:hypothetical protein
VQGYGGTTMPHWIALFAIVVVAWMLVAVAGGWLIGRALGLVERRRHGSPSRGGAARGRDEDDRLRRAA